MTRTASTEDSQIGGILQSMTEIEIKMPELRDPLVKWFNHTFGSQNLPSVQSIRFTPSSASNIIEIHLEIAAASFEKAENITNTFLDTLLTTAESYTAGSNTHPFNAEEVRIMSTGLAPA